jgi:hypothetical protein
MYMNCNLTLVCIHQELPLLFQFPPLKASILIEIREIMKKKRLSWPSLRVENCCM